jgi:hypothetical protein
MHSDRIKCSLLELLNAAKTANQELFGYEESLSVPDLNSVTVDPNNQRTSWQPVRSPEVEQHWSRLSDMVSEETVSAWKLFSRDFFNYKDVSDSIEREMRIVDRLTDKNSELKRKLSNCIENKSSNLGLKISPIMSLC